MLLKEISQYSQCEEGEKEPALRKIVIAYEKGREDQAKICACTDPKTDSYAMIYAAGKLLGEAIGLDGTKIGSALIKAAIKYMMNVILFGEGE